MFDLLIADLVRDAQWAEAIVHAEGLDACIGPFSLHIRQREGLLTVFVPLSGVEPCALADFSDWPVLNLSRLSTQGESMLWARDWVDRLNPATLFALIVRLIAEARVQAAGVS